jgi:hypothetical protein
MATDIAFDMAFQMHGQTVYVWFNPYTKRYECSYGNESFSSTIPEDLIDAVFSDYEQYCSVMGHAC